MIKLYNMSNMEFDKDSKTVDVIFADYIYENLDFSWVDHYWDMLKDDGIFIAMTDFHSQHRFRVYMEDNINGSEFLNHLVWKNEWGRSSPNKFHQCYDDILIYCKGSNYKFYPDRIQVPKATNSSKGLNPSGRTTKKATAWIDDICLTTVSKERISNPKTGKLVEWQKPLKLMDRILLAYTDEEDLIVDPFLGSGTTAAWCVLNNRNCIGIEYDKIKYNIAKRRLDLIAKETSNIG